MAIFGPYERVEQKFEVGEVYYLLFGDDDETKFCKIIARNEKTNKITFQFCDKKGEVYGRKRTLSIKHSLDVTYNNDIEEVTMRQGIIYAHVRV